MQVSQFARRSALAGFVLAVSSGVAGAVTDTDFTYSAYHLGYYPVSASAFAPANTAASSHFYILFGSYLYAPGGAGVQSCFDTSLTLPDQAWLYSIQPRLASIDSAMTTQMRLTRLNFISGVRQVMLDTPVTVNAQSFLITNTDYRHIDRSKYAYALEVCLGGSTQVNSAMIAYHYNSAGE